MTDVYARLAPGQTPEAAQAELRQIANGPASGVSRGVSAVARLRRDRDAVEGRAHRAGAADADDPARHDDVRADHRVRECRQPHADAAGQPRNRNVDPRRARRADVGVAPSTARRESRAVGPRRHRRPRVCRGRTQPADLVRRPLHESHRRDRHRRLGAGLHDDRRDHDRDAVCVGAAAEVRERSGSRHGRRRRPIARFARPPPRAAPAGGQPTGRVVHVADRRGTADAHVDAAVRGRSRVRSRATC